MVKTPVVRKSTTKKSTTKKVAPEKLSAKFLAAKQLVTKSSKLSQKELSMLDVLISQSKKRGLSPNDLVYFPGDVVDAVTDAATHAADVATQAAHEAADAATHAAHEAADAVTHVAHEAADAVTNFADRINENQNRQDQRDMENWQNVMRHVDNAIGGKIDFGDERMISALSRAIAKVASLKNPSLGNLIAVRKAANARKAKR